MSQSLIFFFLRNYYYRTGEHGEALINLSTPEGIKSALDIIDSAMENAISEQAKIGAKQQVLQYSVNNYTTTEENTLSAQLVIQDTDFAKKIVNLNQTNVLNQVNILMMAPRNQDRNVFRHCYSSATIRGISNRKDYMRKMISHLHSCSLFCLY